MVAQMQSYFFAFIVYLFMTKELIGKLDVSNIIDDHNLKILNENGTSERHSSTSKLQICYEISLKGIFNKIKCRRLHYLI